LQEIPTIFLQEYGHRFGDYIHLKLPSGWPLLIHSKVIERATYSKVFSSKVCKMSFIWIKERWPYHHLPKGTFKISHVCLWWNQGNQKGKQGLGPKTQITRCNLREEYDIVSGLWSTSCLGSRNTKLQCWWS
jgi:hypothetical protein